MPAPLFAWGTPEVLNAAPWSAANASVTSGASDPFGENNAFLLSDTSVGASGQVARSVSVPARHDKPVFVVFYAAGSAPSLRIILLDVTATAQRANVLVGSSGSATASVGSVGVVNAGVALSRQWYALVIQATGVVPANAHTLELYPDGSGPGGTGSSYVYLRPTWTHGYSLDNALAQPVARGGSSAVRSPSGVEDAWDYGTDELLSGALRWMPRDFMADPASSGYDGNGTDLVGVGCRSLLRAGRQRLTIRYVRDRGDCTSFVDGYLVEPYDSPTATIEADGTISQPLTLRSTTPYRGEL